MRSLWLCRGRRCAAHRTDGAGPVSCVSCQWIGLGSCGLPELPERPRGGDHGPSRRAVRARWPWWVAAHLPQALAGLHPGTMKLQGHCAVVPRAPSLRAKHTPMNAVEQEALATVVMRPSASITGVLLQRRPRWGWRSRRTFRDHVATHPWLSGLTHFHRTSKGRHIGGRLLHHLLGRRHVADRGNTRPVRKSAGGF